MDWPVDANLRGCPEVTKTIYLANPYGFSAQQRMTLLPPIVAALGELGLEVWEPFARNNQVDFLETGWAYRIGQRDFEDVVAADALFVVVNGVPPDEGVMVELGMAIALGKPVFLCRDDFRRVVDSEQYPLKLIDLGALEILGLGGDGLRGEIPPELGNLSNLTNLSIEGNGFTGKIPPELGNLSNLRDLSIDGNGLTGEIPPELGNLTSLQHLRLRGEGLSGGIPPELGNLKQLYGLYIYSTQLGGAIPPELGNISLTELHLFDNEFSGEIPPWLGNHSYLIGLSLGGNQLSGEIPAEWGNFNRLESLDLSRNQLSGAIPSELGNLDNLKSLTLHENQLSGAIPSELWNLLEREVEIEIHGNQFPCLTGGLCHLHIDQRANC